MPRKGRRKSDRHWRENRRWRQSTSRGAAPDAHYNQQEETDDPAPRYVAQNNQLPLIQSRCSYIQDGSQMNSERQDFLQLGAVYGQGTEVSDFEDILLKSHELQDSIVKRDKVEKNMTGEKTIDSSGEVQGNLNDEETIKCSGKVEQNMNEEETIENNDKVEQIMNEDETIDYNAIEEQIMNEEETIESNAIVEQIMNEEETTEYSARIEQNMNEEETIQYSNRIEWNINEEEKIEYSGKEELNMNETETIVNNSEVEWNMNEDTVENSVEVEGNMNEEETIGNIVEGKMNDVETIKHSDRVERKMNGEETMECSNIVKRNMNEEKRLENIVEGKMNDVETIEHSDRVEWKMNGEDTIECSNRVKRNMNEKKTIENIVEGKMYDVETIKHSDKVKQNMNDEEIFECSNRVEWNMNKEDTVEYSDRVEHNMNDEKTIEYSARVERNLNEDETIQSSDKVDQNMNEDETIEYSNKIEWNMSEEETMEYCDKELNMNEKDTIVKPNEVEWNMNDEDAIEKSGEVEENMKEEKIIENIVEGKNNDVETIKHSDRVEQNLNDVETTEYSATVEQNINDEETIEYSDKIEQNMKDIETTEYSDIELRNMNEKETIEKSDEVEQNMNDEETVGNIVEGKMNAVESIKHSDRIEQNMKDEETIECSNRVKLNMNEKETIENKVEWNMNHVETVRYSDKVEQKMNKEETIELPLVQSRDSYIQDEIQMNSEILDCLQLGAVCGQDTKVSDFEDIFLKFHSLQEAIENCDEVEWNMNGEEIIEYSDEVEGNVSRDSYNQDKIQLNIERIDFLKLGAVYSQDTEVCDFEDVFIKSHELQETIVKSSKVEGNRKGEETIENKVEVDGNINKEHDTQKCDNQTVQIETGVSEISSTQSAGLNLFMLESGGYRFERRGQNSTFESEQIVQNEKDDNASGRLKHSSKDFDSSSEPCTENIHHADRNNTGRPCTAKGDNRNELMQTYFKIQEYMKLKKQKQLNFIGKHKLESETIAEEKMKIKRKKMNQTAVDAKLIQEEQSIKCVIKSDKDLGKGALNEISKDEDKHFRRKQSNLLSQRKHRSQKTQQQRAIDKQKDVNRKREAVSKETPDEAAERRHRNKQSQEGHRKQKTPEQQTRQKQTDVNRKREAVSKETPDEAAERRHRNKQSKEAQRKQKTPQQKATNKVINSERKAQQRQLPNTAEMAIKLFQTAIQEGPTYICTSCNRLLFRGSVIRFIQNDYKDSQQMLVNKCRTLKLSHDNLEYICHTCRNALRKGNLPSIAVANGLKLDEVPLPLKDLSSLEVVFISRRIPFMKLLGLPRGKQKAIHGCVVNIPVEPEQTLSVLPRAPTPDSVVAVKLKRKIQYRGHVVMQNIQPYKVKQALQLLKHGLQNPFYKDVLIDEDWEDNNERQHPELWAALTGDADTEQDNDEEETESVEQQPNELDEGQEDDERSGLCGLPYDSCLEPKAAIEKSNVLLNIAPGEGKRPQPFETDEHAEEMSFPHLFPTGKFGYSMNRENKLSLKKYFQTRILNCDGRFSKNIEYIFYAQYRSEAKEVADSLSIALRKGKQVDVTAGDLKQKASSFINNELGIHFLQHVRGSPAFYNKMLYDLLGMIRQLGACTWFVTLSAADLKWTDTIRIIAQQQGQTLTDEEISNLSWEERCQWLRSNPVTAARHFDDRVQKFMKHIILNKNLNPLGDIADYKYRIEFQQRGSPHLHMLVWCKDAPTFDNNTEEEIAQYVDQHVTCALPTNDDSLKDLVQLVQKHNHSGACRKHGKACRFHFPRLPLKATTAFKPPEEDIPTAKQEYYKEILANVHEELDKLDGDTEVSIDTLLAGAGVNEENYMEALKWFKTKKGQPAIMLKREISEIFINNYNQILMKAWEANLDVQLVTSVLTCVFYVASYVSKPEKTLGDLLKAVSKSGQHLGAKASMRSVAKKFLSHREVCAQEAVYRLLSLPLTQGSRQVLFIPTDLPENRTRLFKPMKVLQQLEDDDPDVFQTNILDRYSARPNKLENMCLAAFAANYCYRTASRKDDNHQGDNSDEDGDSDNEIVDETLPNQIVLKKDLGHMVRRRTQAIIRSHQFSVIQDPEQYYHSQLLLYLPWRNEARDLLPTTYQACHTANSDTIRENKNRFEHHAEDVAVAVENLEEFGAPEENWGDIAAQNEQARAEERQEGAQQDERSIYNALDVTEDQQVRGDLGLIPHSYELLTQKMTSEEYNDLVLSLNDLQSDVHKHILTQTPNATRNNAEWDRNKLPREPKLTSYCQNLPIIILKSLKPFCRLGFSELCSDWSKRYFPHFSCFL